MKTTTRIIIVATLLTILTTPTTALAGPRCPNGTETSRGCSYQIDRKTTCSWPVKMGRERIAGCIRQGD